MKAKRTTGVSLDTILERKLKDDEIRLGFDERRFYLQIARLVADLRAKSGLSQAQLAKAAAVSQPLIARLEKGDQRRTPTFDMVFKVLKALGYRLEIMVQPEKRGKAA
ncbi:MAG: helix-turn-helix domain-containing protein [Bdellovibrionales bacterium]|nr:helix-turn-helix domain-containing protein [Bdellovibrionales bacterium]